ncbi:MAG: alpha/beta hydrolase [Bacteroidales bacterium]
MRRLTIILILCFSFQLSYSVNQVDTISVHSEKMNKEVKNVVIVPKNYSKKKHYPVVYLLHGFGGKYSSYIHDVPELKEFSTHYQMVIVCPDGNNSFYIDSPVDSAYRYESFIINDLIPYIDTHYATVRNRQARAVLGLSMGGHGAFYLAIRHKDLFGHIGSMSGVVNLNGSGQKSTLAKRIGSKEEHPEEWNNRSALYLVDSLKNGEFDIMIDCGVSDNFHQINRDLHDKLLNMKIDHDYVERPGAHNWSYWNNSIKYQLLFINQCFTKSIK